MSEKKSGKHENLGKTKCDICGKPSIGTLVREKSHTVSLPEDLCLCHECANSILIIFGCLLIASDIKESEIMRLLNDGARGKNQKQICLAIDLVRSTHQKKSSE